MTKSVCSKVAFQGIRVTICVGRLESVLVRSELLEDDGGWLTSRHCNSLQTPAPQRSAMCVFQATHLRQMHLRQTCQQAIGPLPRTTRLGARSTRPRRQKARQHRLLSTHQMARARLTLAPCLFAKIFACEPAYERGREGSVSSTVQGVALRGAQAACPALLAPTR